MNKYYPKSPLRLVDRQSLSDYVGAIAWSSRNVLAACTGAGEVALWNPKQSLLHSADGLSFDCLDFSADGQYLAVVGQNGRVKIWQLRAQQTQLIATLDFGSIWIDRLAWHPSENTLAIGVGSQIQLWSADTQKVEAGFDFVDSSIQSLAWHPGGEFLAVGGHKNVKFWQIIKRKTSETLAVPGASISLAWSDDGKYLASGNLDRTLAVLEWGSPPPWFMQGFPAKVSRVAWSKPLTAKGASLLAAVCSEGIALWQREHPTEGNWQNSVLEAHRGFIRAIAFQPGTFLLASAGDDGCIYLWHGTQTVQTLKGAKSGFSCLAWDSSGEKLAAGGQQGEVLFWSKATSAKGFARY